MYSNDRKNKRSHGEDILVVILILMASILLWLACRNAKPLECIQPMEIDNVMYCKIPIKK